MTKMAIVRYLTYCILIVALVACQKHYRPAADEALATLRFVVPAIDAPKRILVIDLYTIEQCQSGVALTKAHKDYRGILLQHEQQGGEKIVREVKVPAQRAVTVTGSLAQLYGEDKSEICYTQFHQFKPSINGIFEVYINEFVK